MRAVVQHIKSYRVAALCCPTPPPTVSPQRQLLQSDAGIASCAGTAFPTPGNCPYATGMVVQCVPTSTYYVINNTMALPFSPASYQAAGSPLPSFITDQCCSTVVNGCGVRYTSPSAYPALFAPLVSGVPGGPAIQWNSVTSPGSLGGLLSGTSAAAGGNILSSANGQFFLQVGLHCWMATVAALSGLTLTGRVLLGVIAFVTPSSPCPWVRTFEFTNYHALQVIPTGWTQFICTFGCKETTGSQAFLGIFLVDNETTVLAPATISSTTFWWFWLDATTTTDPVLAVEVTLHTMRFC